MFSSATPRTSCCPGGSYTFKKEWGEIMAIKAAS